MLEKRKEESDSIGKYQGILTSVVIAAMIMWIAPIMIPYLVGLEGEDADGNQLSGEDLLFAPPSDSELPEEISDRISGLFGILMWFARIVLIFGVIIAVIILRIRQTEPQNMPIALSEKCLC